MPKTKNSKKAPVKNSGVQKLLAILSPDSPKKKFIMFIAAFIVIGGVYMALKTLAEPVGVYWPQQLQSASGSPWVAYTKEGVKKDTVVWYLNKQDAVDIQASWQPVLWAKNVRVCANVFNRARANTVPVTIYPTFNGNPKSKSRVDVPGNGTYQKVCSYYVQHTDPNARIGGIIFNDAPAERNGDQIQVGSMSIEN